MSSLLRASSKGLLRARVARAQGTHRAIPPLLAGFFSILLEAQPDAKQDVLGAKIQRELFPVIIGREVLVLAEQKDFFGQIALHSAKELMSQMPMNLQSPGQNDPEFGMGEHSARITTPDTNVRDNRFPRVAKSQIHHRTEDPEVCTVTVDPAFTGEENEISLP